ncbi:glutaminase A [Nocardioides renjunii]|uniref:glutaminase A n=1 Tax=Nocardioides renjunii TaxID=3095075 RepID=UPI002AFF3EE3|nr:glutaminase A [Nocardioides sp. S-34]WQQ24283.1 glutaminase A [Nocardioides sp. S-34]
MTRDHRHVSAGLLPAPATTRARVTEAHELFRTVTDGSLSTVYPALATADPDLFGLSLVSTAGAVVAAGDAGVPFAIMSVAKPFVFALACELRGIESVRRRVGVNATGMPFSSTVPVERDARGRTNPMVNPGAIATTSLVGGASTKERWELVHAALSGFAGRDLVLDEEILHSARTTNHRNRGLANMLAAVGALDGEAADAVEVYTRQSCLSVTTTDLAVMGATLADGGTNPVTGRRVVDAETAHATLAVMTVAGMYETSGDWLFDVGMPGKSGIAGGIVTVSPGKGALATFSPLLDDAGNSVRGQLATRHLARRLGLDILASEVAPQAARAESPESGEPPPPLRRPSSSRAHSPVRRSTVSSSAAREIDPVPSLRHPAEVRVTDSLPSVAEAAALAVPVSEGADPPGDLGTDAAQLAVLGFTGAAHQVVVLPDPAGRALVALGVGAAASVDTTVVRDLAATFARAVPRQTTLAVELPGADLAVPPADFAQAVVEGVLLARWRFFVGAGGDEPTLTALTLVAPPELVDDVRTGAARGEVVARAAMISRDLSNCPATTLSAERMGEVATELAPIAGLEVELFDRAQLEEMGCGGILGVNRGSVEEPRLIKMSYRPDSPVGHLGLVGKGIMYDSGGISLKPSDESHAQMKNDMTGAAAILGAMTALRDLGCRASVTAYLCCTDNMPSGSAMKLGDVLRMRNGTTVEVLNTDAEGRLVMADGLCLAVEDGVDAVVDVATLTGACLRTFGVDVAGVMGNDASLVARLREAGAVADEPVWELPLHRPYREQLVSTIADMTNMGGANAGSITAALFLEEFVDGVSWAHVDIAGTAQQPAVRTWRNKGASGFGAKLLIELATRFESPGSPR